METRKTKELLKGSRKKVLLRRVNEIKWNRSFSNNSMTDIMSFYEKRIRMLRNTNLSLRENNEELAKSLADQRSLAQSGYNECSQLKSKIMDYHERLVSYQFSDAGKQEEAVVAETERRVEAIMKPINDAIKSGIANATALVDNLADAKSVVESLPKRAKTKGYQNVLTDPIAMSNIFNKKSLNALPPLITGNLAVSSDGSLSIAQQKRQKLSELMRAERLKRKEIQCNDEDDGMGVIEEESSSGEANLEDVNEEPSSSEEASLQYENEQIEESPVAEVAEKKKSLEEAAIGPIRKSKRLTKKSTFNLHLDISSDSDEDSDLSNRSNIDWIAPTVSECAKRKRKNSSVSKRSSSESSSGASTISDFEKHKRSGSYVSKRIRNTRSCNRNSRGSRTSRRDSLCLSFDSAVENEDSPNNCNNGILITPSPLIDKKDVEDEVKSSPSMVNTSMEFTVCLTETDAKSQLEVQSVDTVPDSHPREWFKRKMSEHFIEEKKLGKTPYDTTQMETSPRSFHFELDESPIQRADLDRATSPSRTSKLSLLLVADNEGDDQPTAPILETDKENYPQNRKIRKTSRLTKRTSRYIEYIATSKHMDSPAKPCLTDVQSYSVESNVDISPPVKIKVERASSISPISRLSEVKNLQTSLKLSPNESEPAGRRRRAAAPVSLMEPKINRKLRQGDDNATSIYPGFIPSVKEKNNRKKRKK